MFSAFEQFALNASGGKFFFVSVLCLATGAGAMAFAWINLVRKRVIQDMPTAKLRSAHQGYIELQGRAELMDGAPIYSPLSREICVWYRFKVEKKETEGFRNSRDSKWRTTSQGTSDDLFYLVDDTGKCAVDPEGAKVTTGHKRVWYGRNATAPAYAEESMLAHLSGFSQLGKSYRFTEERIVPGDPLYALGNFRTHGGAGVNFDLNTEVGEVLREWKKDSATMLSKFDTNQDGEIDMQEWDQARQAAEAQVVREREKQAVAPPVDLLAKSGNRRNPFILTTRSEHDMLNAHHWTAVASFVVGGPLLIGTIWTIISRLSQ
ncbi:MAG: GIDE domain-containing protein [Gammaproteobacteria bacterium]